MGEANEKFKKNFLEFLKVSDMEMEYAQNNKLFDLKNKLYRFRIYITTKWLSFIALEDNPDIESAKIILADLKKNGFNVFKYKTSLKRKCFIWLSFINFNLASIIYKFITGKLFCRKFLL